MCVRIRLFVAAVLYLFILLCGGGGWIGSAHAFFVNLRQEWPRTDFNRTDINLMEIGVDGALKDMVQSIDNPEFTVARHVSDLISTEPVIQLVHEGVAKAYPLRTLIWHEIVNDQIAGMPVAVTYCPLSSAALVFDRRITDEDGKMKTLEFGVTGKLHISNMIMYDRETESWWQQYTGQGIIGALNSQKLHSVMAQIVPFAQFLDQYPDSDVLMSPSRDSAGEAQESGIPYGFNPYVRYDQASLPPHYQGIWSPGNSTINPMDYVVAVGDRAWALSLLQKEEIIKVDDIIITWKQGMGSVLNDRDITKNPDTGYVSVQQSDQYGVLRDIPYMITFAFAFDAFHLAGSMYDETDESIVGKATLIPSSPAPVNPDQAGEGQNGDSCGAEGVDDSTGDSQEMQSCGG